MAKIGRLLTAMVTPFNEKGQVAYDQARKLSLALINSGSDGLIISGTTGESPVLSKDEKLKLFSEVKQAVGDRGYVVANTGNYNTADSVELTKKAQETGVDAILIVVPPYNRPTQEGLFQHFSVVASATDLPCILYNVPGRTVTNLAAETVVRLSNVKNIIGVKEASGNLAQISQIIEETHDEFLVFSGNDSDTLPILSIGGYGVISVAAHLVGNQIKEMINNFINRKTDEAAIIHRRLMPLVDSLFIVSNPSPTKYALNKLGFFVGKPRLPLVEPDEKSAAIIDATIKKYQIDLK